MRGNALIAGFMSEPILTILKVVTACAATYGIVILAIGIHFMSELDGSSEERAMLVSVGLMLIIGGGFLLTVSTLLAVLLGAYCKFFPQCLVQDRRSV